MVRGAEARFLVKEQLASLNFPTDAVGATKAVQGNITLSQDGAVLPERSKITVDLSSLKTDDQRRDNYIRQNALSTVRYPQGIFVPRQITELPWPLPKEGGATFQIIGDLTVHGVTKSIVWDVAAAFSDDDVTAYAATHTTFGTFGMGVPRVFVVLSVEDNIRLEVDFLLRRVTPEG